MGRTLEQELINTKKNLEAYKKFKESGYSNVPEEGLNLMISRLENHIQNLEERIAKKGR